MKESNLIITCGISLAGLVLHKNTQRWPDFRILDSTLQDQCIFGQRIFLVNKHELMELLHRSYFWPYMNNRYHHSPVLLISIAQNHLWSSRGHHCHPDNQGNHSMRQNTRKVGKWKQGTWHASLPPSLCPAHTWQQKLITRKPSSRSALPSLYTRWAWCLWPYATPHSP